MIDLVVFDCDGVLVDSEVLSVQAMAAVLVEAGVPALLDGLRPVVDRAALGNAAARLTSPTASASGAPARQQLPELLALLLGHCADLGGRVAAAGERDRLR